MVNTDNLKLFVAAQERKLQAKLDAEAALGRHEPVHRHMGFRFGRQDEMGRRSILQRRFQPAGGGRHLNPSLHYELAPRP